MAFDRSVVFQLLALTYFIQVDKGYYLSNSLYLDSYPKLADISLKNKSIPLYFGLMLSLSGDDESSGALAGVQAALDEINSRDDLLPGYMLHYTLTDSKVKYHNNNIIITMYLCHGCYKLVIILKLHAV